MVGLTRPTVSIVMEGFNEAGGRGTALEILAGLKAQRFPLQQVEIVLIGTAAQAAAWRELSTSPAPFAAIEVAVDDGAHRTDGAHYYWLKDQGARLATGEII